MCAIATNVDIGTGDYFRFLSPIMTKYRPALALIVSPHESRFAIVLLLVLVLAASARATSIVVAFSGNQIILSADSVVTRIENGTKTFPAFCKIRTRSRVFYAIAGDYGEPGTEYDVWKITRDSIRNADKIVDIYDAVRSAMLPKVEYIATRNKVFDPETSRKWVNGDPVIEMVFAGRAKAGPVVLGVSFYIDKNGKAADPPSRDIIYPVRDRIVAGRIGQHQEIERALTSATWQRHFSADPIDASRELIQLEIDAAAREGRYDVGLPIVIATIEDTKSGFVKNHGGTCCKSRPKEKHQKGDDVHK